MWWILLRGIRMRTALPSSNAPRPCVDHHGIVLKPVRIGEAGGAGVAVPGVVLVAARMLEVRVLRSENLEERGIQIRTNAGY